MQPDVVVVGSGPNGLTAALTAARAGLSVHLIEAADTIGGGTRTAELTLPGFHHDVASAVHPAALASPAFSALELDIDWILPELSYAHPFADGRVGLAWHDLDRTAEGLGVDAGAWRGLFAPLIPHIDGIVDFTGSQLLRWPAHPLAALQYGLRVIEQGSRAQNLRFRGEIAPALLTGAIAHAAGRLPSLAGAGAGMLLAAHGHAGGWPVPRGGAQAIADALLGAFIAHGGTFELNREVRRLDEISAPVVLLDTTPDILLTGELPQRYSRALTRYRYGSGVAKVDFALSGPVPWRAAEVGQAPTVHLGGSRTQIQQAENAVAAGRVAEQPYVLVSQPSVVDDSRAPAGQQVLWTYMHVPNGSPLDPTEQVTRAIEQVAPDFRDVVLESTAQSAAQLGSHNLNYPGGDIFTGALTVRQMLKRPVLSMTPWRTPIPGVYLCSAATPPGPAVHGMNGWHAARLALREHFGLS
ncbi:MAG: phytoene desaturase family protein [Microbacteriaceae bacterium]